MRILVTGGAGYIGSHAVRLFLDAATTSGSTTTSRSAIAPRCRRSGSSSATWPRSHRLDQRPGRAPHRGGRPLRRLRLRRRVGAATRRSTTRTTSSTRSTCSSACAGTASAGSSSPAPAPPTACPSECRSPRTSRRSRSTPTAARKLAVEQALARLRRAPTSWGFAALRYFNAAGRQPRRQHRRGPRPGDAPDPAGHPGGARASGRTSRSSAPTTRRPTAPASATTSTSTTWPRPTCWPWRSCEPGQATALQPRHRPRLQRPRGDPHGRGGDRQEGAGQGRPAPRRRPAGAGRRRRTRSSRSWAGSRATPTCGRSSRPPGTGTARIRRATMTAKSGLSEADRHDDHRTLLPAASPSSPAPASASAGPPRWLARAGRRDRRRSLPHEPRPAPRKPLRAIRGRRRPGASSCRAI